MKYSSYPSYRDSGISWLGQIPTEWEVPSIKMLLSVHKGINTEDNPTVLSVTLNGIKVKDIESGEGQLAASYDNYNPVTPKHIVLNPMDLISGFVGKPPVKGVVSPAYISMSVPDKCHTDYYVYLLQKLYYEKILFPYGKGVSYDFRWTINNETFFNLPTLYPHLQEQQTIANYLDIATAKIDTLIAKQTKLIELLKEKRQALISTAVTKGLDSSVAMKDSGVEWLGEIPEHWEAKPAQFIANITRGAILRPVDAPEYFEDDGEWSYLNISDATKCDKYLYDSKLKLSKLGSQKSARVYPDNVIITASATIGKAFINKIKVCVHDGFIPFTQIKIYKDYLYHYLSNPFLYAAMGKSNTQKNIYLDEVKRMIVTVPPIDEQIKIVNYLEAKSLQMNKLIDKSIQAIELLKEKRTALISSAVTGKIDVRDIL